MQLDDVSIFFSAGGSRKLVWFYQDVEDWEGKGGAESRGEGQRLGTRWKQSSPMVKKRLFLADPSSVSLKGICIYALKMNPEKNITEDNIPKVSSLLPGSVCGSISKVSSLHSQEVSFGCVMGEDNGLLSTFERLLAKMYVPVLNENGTDLDKNSAGIAAKDELLACLQSVSSTLLASEEALVEKVILPEGQVNMSEVSTREEITNIVSLPQNVMALENAMKSWIARIEKVLIEGNQLRKEVDEAGPQKELEYWKKRTCQFYCLMEQIKSPQVKMTVLALQTVKSRLLKPWRQIEHGVTDGITKARNNVKYISSIEKQCNPLYLGDPITLVKVLPGLFNTIRMIHLVSPYYNTSERLSGLLIKITNQMIKTCKRYVTNHGIETVWTQPRDLVKEKLNHCLQLNSEYRRAYVSAQETLRENEEPPFQFSQQYVFGKFHAFSKRLQRILDLFAIIDKYNRFLHARVDGLLPEDKALEEIIASFEEMADSMTRKPYDCLDYQNRAFDHDCDHFVERVNLLIGKIREMLESQFQTVWTSPQGYQFLLRFEKIADSVPGIDIGQKYAAILKTYTKTLDKIKDAYNKNKEIPPIQRALPPVAGSIWWVRGLFEHIAGPMRQFKGHSRILKQPDAGKLIRRFTLISEALTEFEIQLHALWKSENISHVQNSLSSRLLIRHPDLGYVIVNFDSEISILIREAECLRKMELSVPGITEALSACKGPLTEKKSLLEHLLRENSRVRNAIPGMLRPMLVSHLGRLDEAMEAAFSKLAWTSLRVPQFVEMAITALSQFETLVNRLSDIYRNRIEAVLLSMHGIIFHTLPDNIPWTLEEFLERTHDSCLKSARLFQSRNELMEESVMELLNLILQTDPLQGDEEELDHDDPEKKPGGTKQPSLLEPPPGTGVAPTTYRQKALKRRRELKERIDHAASELRRYYNMRILEVLVKITRNALDEIRKRVLHVRPEPDGSPAPPSSLGLGESSTPMFSLSTHLSIPQVKVQPSVDEVQDTIIKGAMVIISVSKGVCQWIKHQKFPQDSVPEKQTGTRRPWNSKRIPSEERYVIPAQPKNFYQHVLEHKDISKAISQISTCLQSTKLELQDIFERWQRYFELWNDEREGTVRAFLQTSPSITDFEDKISYYLDMERAISREPDSYCVGAVTISMENLKLALNVEVKGWITRIGRACKVEYRRKMDKIFAQINDLSRKLSRPIRDLDDLRIGMQALRLIREKEIDMEMAIDPIEASKTPLIFRNRFDSLWRRHVVYAAGEELFGLEPSEYPHLGRIKKELNLLQKLYRLYNDVIDRVTSYYDILWIDVNIEEINNELMEFQNRRVKEILVKSMCRKLPKGLKEWPAFNTLKKTIDDFNDMCPLLELMANKAMKPRHWTRIAELTGHTFNVEAEHFSLKHIMEAPLLQYKEDIEDICISAVKEKDIEAKLRQVTNEWSMHELSFMHFKNRGELLLRGDSTADIITMLEDSLMVLGSLLSNRYNPPFRKQIQKWVSDLSNTNEILERWLFVQNLWVYLEAVFVGGDIAKQLPKEAKRFYAIDKSWQKIMGRAHEIPNVVQCCVGDDTLKQLLPHLQEQLELCQKSLSGYLERKRLMFPRFFFVSDPALLEILGQASDSHTIQSHLLSIFDNTKNVVFHDQDYDRIVAIESSEGETITLERPVRAEGSVEVWLMRLLQMAQQSMHSIIRSAHAVINDPNFNVLTFLGSYPAQVGILGLQMIWTRDSEAALVQAKVDRKVMMETNNRFLDLLNILISQTTKDLSAVERTKFETLITVHVHQRDIFDNLCRLNVRNISDFEWLKQCRFYFREDSDKTSICITDVNFTYQNEFLGCTERLVITPLTDRCYITLAQALGMSMGGSPTGPAGTGKTETTKDMGKTLGKYVVCTDYFHICLAFEGLAQSGSWGCFDEFNRIDLPVLSVAAQQIAVILSCKKERRKHFTFTDGDIVDMNPEFGTFLTMNPGYAGRQELPENLKIQFRTVAMMVPDRQIIIRVKLASCGFLENITLARKFFTLYKLCEEQLTKQVHYDFGLRNILSVLRTLGAAKRANPKDSESTIVMRVLRDMNLSKLVDEDEPLFMSLINDLFPNITLDKAGYPDLETAIADQVKAAGLINHPAWTLKLIQLYETQRVRHGMMTLGPSGSGKTSCIQILMKALTQCGQPHREMRMNPKAITAPQMFGRLDVATNDWTDGIYSTLWRRTHKAKKGEHIWLVLDGPVDAIWIENLNSVLDDNKTLTLANGDRIPMAPNCKVIFEPHNIDNASPATVSRNGMVYMSSSGLDWKPIFSAWVANRTPNETTILKDLFENNFLPIYTWSTQTLIYKMEVLQINVIIQMLNLLTGLLPPEEKASIEINEDGEDEPQQPKKQSASVHIGRIFVFSLMWSIGALLELDDRLKLEIYLRDNKSSYPLDLPPDQRISTSTMFDYMVDPQGNWVHWNLQVQEYIYPDNYTPDFSSILVPNVDNVRTDFLIGTIAKQGKAVMLLGEQGSAKTVMMDAYLKKCKTEYHLSRTMNFSSASTPLHFQKSMESYIDKRMGSTYGPPAGKRMTVFIDDINMPLINEWGDQVTNEIVRQTIEMGGFYNLEKPGDFTHIVDVQYVAAMIQPGGGRNDIPSRLKRHFSIFNCTIPSDASIDKIFGVIAKGHYSTKRGFSMEVQNLISKLVPLTRKVWSVTKATVLPTPAKFHYVFNLRDLSRIWQGMIGTLSTVIDSEKTLMALWKHETYRVVADRHVIELWLGISSCTALIFISIVSQVLKYLSNRFITSADKEWFEKTLIEQTGLHLGSAYADMVMKREFFVDFLRDAPEPTGDETEELDMEMPKVYEPIPSFEILEERLRMFLSQYNEMIRGAGMDLVFFHDAMISRIIRNPGGNALLVGVGGSGKQSLTKLASFIAGYKTFQITLTRSYNANNFLEDLKVLYRTCGIQGKGTTFIFTDQDVKDEGFLEYLNNVLSSGVVSNLFNRDEQSEIIMELIPIMKREHPRRAPTPENVMEYFVTRVRQNLHVVLCFSPVGEKFRNRALKFPGLFSGCTIDWFQPWPKDALVAVADHYLLNFDVVCTDEVKVQLVEAMGTYQDIVSTHCAEYFQRYRRAAHVTPKSYLSFINSYKSIYSDEKAKIGDLAERMNSGLAKLQEASESVARLRQELFVMEHDLAEASDRAEKVLSEVTIRAQEAEFIRNQMQRKKDDAQALVDVIAVDKALAEEKLADAKPALEEAEAALNTIKPAHIATIRKLGRPPHLIMRIMDSVLILFRRRLHPVVQDIVPCPKPSWSESLKMMASATFLQQLQTFPKDTINDEMVELLEPYLTMEDYNMETATRVCGDVAGLLSWTKAMAFFFSVNKEVLPLKANLALQEARLGVAMKELQRSEMELAAKEASLASVREQYAAAVAETRRLASDADTCRRKMQAAETLINGLAGEKQRWTKQSRTFKDQIGSSDVKKYLWKECEKVVTITICVHINISEWNLQGLPNDELSIQNALIATKASCYPLLIDPQGQGKQWIKNREAKNELQITSLNHKYFRTHLEDSLSLGRPLLIEDINEELDPILDNLLEKNFIKSGTIDKVLIGDKEFDIMPGFVLYITTKLPNPAYTPEISAKTSIIDFTVTLKGLEDQLLGRVILTEKSELEAERVHLIEDVMENKKAIKTLEDNLLYRLTSTQTSLVDDEDLISVLQDTKATAQEVSQKLQVAAETEAKINLVREEFRPVATRGSILYFLIVEMSSVNIMYQTSLRQFLMLFELSMAKSEKSSSTIERIKNIINFLTYSVWKYASRGYYEKHKFLFTLLMAIKIDLERGKVSHEEFMTLIKVDGSHEKCTVIVLEVSDHEKEWRAWFEAETPEQEELPSGYGNSLDVFRTLLLIRSWCPDRTLSQAKKYIAESLGEKFNEPPILDLEMMWGESDPHTPLICFLAMGADPSSQIENLAKGRDIPMRSISMGQGQEIHGRRLLHESMSQGGWLLLQNCHLSLAFCNEVMDAVLETSNIHKGFRLWITTEVNSNFPIGLLQMSIKFTNEPPQGIKASLKRTYAGISQDLLDYSNAPQWQPLLYGVAFLHTVVLESFIFQERRKYGSLGWNIPYDFNQADFTASVQFVQNHLDDMDPKRGVSWNTICYMLGEVQYGGRVTDDFDHHLLKVFAEEWFTEKLFAPDFNFYPGYTIPRCKTPMGYLECISSLPSYDSPEVFGLHSNADITYQINTAKSILDMILNIQPKEGSSLGGETREAVVYRLADDMLSKLPQEYVSFEVKEAIQRMGGLLPMNIFLRQEVDRMKRVVQVVRVTLTDLKLAIDGTIIMNQLLRESLDAMYDARVPEAWKKISWESATLGFWFTELIERDVQFRRWCFQGRPHCFWMTGMFNPQGFLTAMRQEVTRAHKGWALDSVVLQNLVTKFNKEDITESPPEGVYVYGLFLEGATWDKKKSKLAESRPKVLYEPLPVLYIYAINSTAGKDPRLYECPIYRKPQRTDRTYIGSIDFETEQKSSHWTLRGVALLCDIK
ncbi:unnamed protein product [Darwinula stevensoni]|uniref:Dynein heavy chain 5, axonemal n=1 Tax=Darwinula stevensoni TaxID=69355 RepID=A0A7R8X7L5_9CRUS|nr:unnamed protein product [Darwinula stevensoni]CAG0887043.1 unnamed protein product [Darwinula stevensoni]